MRGINKKTVVALVGVTALAVGGAYAYWTAGGSGTGTAQTGTTNDLVVNQTSTVTDMGPGDIPQQLSGDFNNPGPSPVYVASVQVVVDSTDQPGCGPDDYLITGDGAVGQEIPVGDGVGIWGGLAIQFNDLPGVNQDACKGALVTLAYTTTG